MSLYELLEVNSSASSLLVNVFEFNDNKSPENWTFVVFSHNFLLA